MDHAEKMAKEKIPTLLLQFSIPAIIAMLVGALYNVIDRIYIGHSAAGTLGIAAMTISLPVMLFIWACGTLIGVGASSLVSIKLGEKKIAEAERVVGNALILLIFASIAITIAGMLLLTPILKFYGASSDVLPYAKDYMAVFFGGTLFLLVGFGMNNFIRAEGNPQKAMLTMVTGPILNILIAPIFIYWFGWGMIGAALATVVAQTISTVLVIAHFFGKKSVLKIRTAHLKPEGAVIGKIIALGAAPFVLQIVTSIATVIVNNKLIKYGGDIAVSGMGTVASIQILITMTLMGINQGMQPIIGFNFGAKHYDRVKETLKYAAVSATLVATLSYILTRLIPDRLIAIFNSHDAQLVAFGSHAMSVYLFCLPVIGFQIIGLGYFQAIGKAKQAILLSLSRQVLIFIPALFILPRFFQMQGVLVAGPIADSVSFLITGILLLVELRHLNRESREHQLSKVPITDMK